jgi:hypothetical protein
MSTPLNLEVLSMYTLVFLLFAVVIMKVVTVRLLIRMKLTIKEVQDEKALLLNDLKNATAQRSIQERNKAAIERKLVKREKKLRELSIELQEYEEDNERRESKRSEIKKQLIR